MTGSSTEHPLVYCIVLTFGQNPDGRTKRLLTETLDSLEKMNYPNFKIIVVDNGSTDGSQEMVRTQYPQAILIENGKNLGFGGGNNVGMEYALERGAEWIFLLNNDIIVDASLLTEMMRVAVSHPMIGGLGPKIYFHDEPEKFWYAGGAVNFWAGIISHRGIREIDHGQYDVTTDTEYITGCAFLVRREALEQTGMFDPVFHPAYSEDADLSARIQRAGYRLMFVHKGKLWHKVSSSSGGGMTPFKVRLKVEHNLIYFMRYARWYHWITIPWCISTVAMVFIVAQLARGNFAIIAALLQGFGSAINRLRSV
ncbi:MAG: glycosyltransferase family 2 protein [Bacteroidota bacterium]